MGKPRWMQWDSDKPAIPAGLKKHLSGQKRNLPTRAIPPATTPSEPIKYETYMKSQEWSRFRQRWFNDWTLPNACAACCASTSLELHHVTYARLGAERLNDVVPLCRRCHIEFHERYTSHQSNGLEEFQKQLSIAFRLSQEVVAIRLKPFLDFTSERPRKQQKPKGNAAKVTRRQKKAINKLSGAVRFQTFHDKYSPKRHDPLS